MPLVCADARQLPFPTGYVQCVITSPPYWGLRDYGLGSTGIGLEATPDLYVDHLLEVFQEIWRVLRADGTVWLVIGDSYVRDARKGKHQLGQAWKQNYIIERGGGRAASQTHLQSEARGSHDGVVGRADRAPVRIGAEGLKAKDLVGIPWRVAFALRAAGWYLRADIIWAKSNPLPGSQKDRPTSGHEYIFLLTKQERYFLDYTALREPSVDLGRGAWTDTSTKQAGHSRRHAGFNARYNERLRAEGAPALRTMRSVWTVATQPYKGAHFATFPEKLVRPCLLAGSAHWRADPARCVVLDPFCGSGTVGRVARQQGRAFLGCDRKIEYLHLAQQRIYA